MEEAKILTTHDLIKISHDSDEHGYNRLLSAEFLEKLDPEGTHLLTFDMSHEHAAGVQVDPHVRTLWLVKLKGQEKPVEMTLDMTLENFNGLTTLRKNADGDYEVVIGAHGLGRK